MKLKMLLTAIAVAIISSCTVYAQKVSTFVDKGTKFATIDCFGMDPRVYTDVKKGNNRDYLKTAEANAKIYHRFTFAMAYDEPYLSWMTAFEHCDTLGPDWRVPTFRELMLMWVLTPELGDDMRLTLTDYISATELVEKVDRYWMVSGYDGTLLDIVKTSGNGGRLRCIKEL